MLDRKWPDVPLRRIRQQDMGRVFHDMLRWLTVSPISRCRIRLLWEARTPLPLPSLVDYDDQGDRVVIRPVQITNTCYVRPGGSLSKLAARGTVAWLTWWDCCPW